MQSDLLLSHLGDQMYHFIHLTLRLFSRNTSENADVVENSPSLPWNFLRAWWRLSCYVLHIDEWGKRCNDVRTRWILFLVLERYCKFNEDNVCSWNWQYTLLKKHPHTRPVFKGVYARNRLPRLLSLPLALVGNTDPDHRMGQHWVAMYIDANSRVAKKL
jgi:hypothetical protein